MRCDDGVYAGTGIYGTTGRLGEALIVWQVDFKSDDQRELPLMIATLIRPTTW
ncbi:hypothetical protein ACNKHR_14755 [Shigella flexneri]